MPQAKENPKAARLRRWQVILKPLVRRVEAEAMSGGEEASVLAKKLGITEQPWRKMRAGTYPHPGLLKTMQAAAAANCREAGRRLQLSDLIDHVFDAAPNPYATSQLAGSNFASRRCVIASPPVKEFVGRRAILRRIEEFLFDREHTVFYLYGGQGIGKSEVVRFLLHNLMARGALATHFPDGATLANRNVPEEIRPTLARTMTVVLEALFGNYQPPSGDEEMIARDFLNQLRGKKALVAVDNVHGQTEAERLSEWAVLGLGKVILVGLARPDTRPDWRSVELGPFDECEVREYLQKYYSTVENEVIKDTPLHNNRPKYVWKSAQYHSDPAGSYCASSEEFLQQKLIGEAERRHLSLLPTEERNALCALTVCQGPFKTNAADAILRKGGESIGPYLARLVGLSWLSRDVEGQFSLLFVERAELLAVREPAVTLQAYLRYGEYLLEKLATLEARFLQGGNESRDARLEFNRYRDDFFAAFDHLAQAGGVTPDAAAVARRFVSASPNLLFVLFPYSRQRQWAEQVRRVRGYDTDPLCQYYACWFLNLYAYVYGQFVEAQRLANERVELSRELRRPDLLIEALFDLGHAETRLRCRQSDRPVPLSRHFLAAAKHAKSVQSHSRLLCHLSFHLAWAHMYAHEFDKAAEYFESTLTQADNVGDLFAKGRTLINISRNLRKQGRMETALSAGMEAHQFAKELHSNVLVALSSRNLAKLYAAKGDEMLVQVHRREWNEFKTNSEHPQINTSPHESSHFQARASLAVSPALDK